MTGTVQPSVRRRSVLLLAGATGVALLASILARTPGRAAAEPELAREAVPAAATVAATVDAPPATTGATAAATAGVTTGATAASTAGATAGPTTGATAAAANGSTTGATAGASPSPSDAPASVRDTATRRRSKARAETPRPGASTTPAKPPRDLDAMFPGGR